MHRKRRRPDQIIMTPSVATKEDRFIKVLGACGLSVLRSITRLVRTLTLNYHIRKWEGVIEASDMLLFAAADNHTPVKSQ